MLDSAEVVFLNTQHIWPVKIPFKESPVSRALLADVHGTQTNPVLCREDRPLQQKPTALCAVETEVKTFWVLPSQQKTDLHNACQMPILYLYNGLKQKQKRTGVV